MSTPSPTVFPISQSRDTGIIPNISHCTGSHPLSLPSNSPRILGLSWTYRTILCLTQSLCPSHPTVPGYWDYLRHIPLYWVSLSPTVLPIPQSRDTAWDYPEHIPLYWVSLSPTVLPIPQSRDTGIIPNISHCTGSHSVPLSFPFHSPGILGLYPLYWVSLSPNVIPIPSQCTSLKYITLLQIKGSFRFYFMTIMKVCYVENEENKSCTVHFSSHLDGQEKVCSNGRQVALQSKICPGYFPMTGECQVEWD